MARKKYAPGVASEGAAAVFSSDNSADTVELHEQSQLRPRVALSDIVAEALASGLLCQGGRFRLCGGMLRRGAGR